MNPGVLFLPQPVAQSTGAMPFGDVGVVETTLGKAGTINTVMTDQFGGFGFGYGSQFGTVKSISFTLQGPFINNIASVITPNGAGFLAAAKIYDGTISGFVGGNGAPAPVTPVPEPLSIALIGVSLGAALLCHQAGPGLAGFAGAAGVAGVAGTRRTVMRDILTGVVGLSSESRGTFDIASTMSCPVTTSPKMVCLPFSHGVGATVMKNCDPLVFGPELAMARIPGLSNPCAEPTSSANL